MVRCYNCNEEFTIIWDVSTPNIGGWHFEVLVCPYCQAVNHPEKRYEKDKLGKVWGKA